LVREGGSLFIANDIEVKTRQIQRFAFFNTMIWDIDAFDVTMQRRFDNLGKVVLFVPRAAHLPPSSLLYRRKISSMKVLVQFWKKTMFAEG
jgi:hypothetical protein